jgi:hypothetical protein
MSFGDIYCYCVGEGGVSNGDLGTDINKRNAYVSGSHRLTVFCGISCKELRQAVIKKCVMNF